MANTIEEISNFIQKPCSSHMQDENSQESDNNEQLNEKIQKFNEDGYIDQSDLKLVLNSHHVKDVVHKLGLIKLCWPDISQYHFANKGGFPESYISNSEKEKVLLLYAENFRLQFSQMYPSRRPLFLVCENECGIQVSQIFHYLYSTCTLVKTPKRKSDIF